MKAYKILLTVFAIIAIVSIFYIEYGIFITAIGVMTLLYYIMIRINIQHKLKKTTPLKYIGGIVLAYPSIYIILVLIGLGFNPGIIPILVALLAFNVYSYITNLKTKTK